MNDQHMNWDKVATVDQIMFDKGLLTPVQKAECDAHRVNAIEELKRHETSQDVPKTRWTAERIARLGFLIGLGWNAKRVSEDPLIVSTANNVHRQAQRFGLAFRAVPASPFKLSDEAHARYDAAAAKRGLTREALMRQVLMIAAEDPALIDNILDDGAMAAQ